MAPNQALEAKRFSSRLQRKALSKQSQPTGEEEISQMPERSTAGKAGKRNNSVFRGSQTQNTDTPADVTQGRQRAARRTPHLGDLAAAAAAVDASQGPDSQNYDPNPEANRQPHISQDQEEGPSQKYSQNDDEAMPDRSDGENYSEDEEERDPEIVRQKKRAKYTDLDVLRSGLGIFEGVEDMSNRALLGLILREMLLNNMLTAEVILEMEEHNHLLKQVNTTKEQSSSKTSSSKAAADLKGPLEELMWKEGFWLPNGCDAAICKDTGTRSVDELKLKNMATYEIYSKEAGKVALELRKARNAEAKGALQWAFGSLMKLDRSKEEAKEADAMLNGKTYVRMKVGERNSRRYSEPRFRAAAGFMFGRLSDENEAPEMLDLLPAQLAFLEFWARLLLSGKDSIPTIQAKRRPLINDYETLRVEIAAVKGNPFIDMSGWP